MMRRPGIYRLLEAAIAFAALAGIGCNGFGTGDATQPGSTPPIGAQVSFRFLGTTNTPFAATISDARSSWRITGVVPLTVIIVNQQNPTRIVGTKLTNDTALFSAEVLSGFSVQDISSTYFNYGTVVASFGDKLKALAPPASPDVRFFVRGPSTAVFNATVEDLSNSYVVQSRVPTMILFDQPNSGSQTERVDGLFSIVQLIGPMSIELSFNGRIVEAGGPGGTIPIKIN